MCLQQICSCFVLRMRSRSKEVASHMRGESKLVCAVQLKGQFGSSVSTPRKQRGKEGVVKYEGKVAYESLGMLRDEIPKV